MKPLEHGNMHSDDRVLNLKLPNNSPGASEDVPGNPVSQIVSEMSHLASRAIPLQTSGQHSRPLAPFRCINITSARIPVTTPNRRVRWRDGDRSRDQWVSNVLRLVLPVLHDKHLFRRSGLGDRELR